MTTAASRSVVIFDLGGVLLDWNPRYLYRKLIPEEAACERFLAEVCHPAWNVEQDGGRSFAEAEAEAIARHPDKADLIRAWLRRFDEMIPTAIQGTVDILERLHASGVPLYALTNFSRETFPPTKGRFPFFSRFRGIVVSGDERMLKPEARIYQLLCSRYGVRPEDAVFIDDSQKNAEGAGAIGIHGIHFRAPAQLEEELRSLGFL
ncbi:MAG: HAD family phosphatase [Alphaproteobacteria bacterium]|nr:HAD family phosphatase [Alphaproteobacteria bacterium]